MVFASTPWMLYALWSHFINKESVYNFYLRISLERGTYWIDKVYLPIQHIWFNMGCLCQIILGKGMPVTGKNCNINIYSKNILSYFPHT